MLKKMKQPFKRFMNGKSGFSLVELIVVIAIMAVMAAVLAPALLGYVERSRAQKDDSAMSEVVSAMRLSLADQEIYDEVLEHSVWDNVSCYIDSASESAHTSNKIILKDAYGDKVEQYMFNDNARLLDEIDYYAAGNMRGLTITFSPDKESNGDTYNLKDGILNKFVGRKTGYLYENPELYNRIRSVIGDTLETTSQTYRNSDYTIFIKVGSTGGAEAVMQDAIQVWGQFSGTNLDKNPNSFKFASERVVGDAGRNDSDKNQYQSDNSANVDFSEGSDLNHKNLIPYGGIYTVVNTEEVLQAGEAFPETSLPGDIYVYEDYQYTFLESGMGWNAKVVNKNQKTYSELLHSINNYPLTDLEKTFLNCSVLEVSPTIPKTVTNMKATFAYCYALKHAPTIPEGVTNMFDTFSNCKNLVSAPVLPQNITILWRTFWNCKQLESAPVIPSSVTKLEYTFKGCTNLKTAPVIHENVEGLSYAFEGCTALTGTIVINSRIISAAPSCFAEVNFDTQNITLTGNSTKLDTLGQTGLNYCEHCNGTCQSPQTH